MGMKNHEVVPIDLALKISRCRRGTSSFMRLLREQLIPIRLLAFDSDSKHSCHGYRLTNLGYDYLALHQLFKSGQLCDLGTMVGAGKESDVYAAIAGPNCGRLSEEQFITEDKLPNSGDVVIIKFHRLGRTSFRKVKEKRDYHEHRNKCSWLYLDRLASYREFIMMQAKHILETIVSVGLIHGDFNEFNLMVSGLRKDFSDSGEDPLVDAKLVLIDFPQMISRDHKLAHDIYLRDMEGITTYFNRYFDVPLDDLPPESIDDIKRIDQLDVVYKIPGYITRKTRQRNVRLTLEDSLIGNVARLKLSNRDSTSDDSLSEQSSSEELYENDKIVDTSCRLEACHDDDDDDDQTCEYDKDSTRSNDANSDCDLSEKSLKLGTYTENTTKQKVSKKHQVRMVNGPECQECPAVMSTYEIRERHRREHRQQNQIEFQHRLKRHNRAETKRLGRNNLKTELILFGL